MKAKSLVIAASVIGMTLSGASVANVAAPGFEAPPLKAIQLAENDQPKPIQLAAKGRHKAFIAGALVGGLVGHAVTKNRAQRGYYRDAPPRRRSAGSYQAAQDRCARRYRSYSYRTDTFVTYSGYEKLCPYVRPWY